MMRPHSKEGILIERPWLNSLNAPNSLNPGPVPPTHSHHHNLELMKGGLTFIDSVANVAAPSSLVDESDEGIYIGPRKKVNHDSGLA